MVAPPPAPSDPPRPPVVHAAWLTAKRAVLAALADGETLVALTGPPGVGKTRLLRELDQALRAPGRPVARLDDGSLLEPTGLPPLLLVDEADRITDEALLALARRGAGLAVLAGLPGFAARLAGLPHRVVALAPLRPKDVPAYVAARLAETGLDGRRLAEGTLSALAEAAQGVPARLNLLTGTSFLAADIAGAAQVAPLHVREAVAMHAELAAEVPDGAAPAPVPAAPPSPPPPGRGNALVVVPPRRRTLPWRYAAAALLLAGGLGWLAWPEAPPPVATLAGRAVSPVAPPSPATASPAASAADSTSLLTASAEAESPAAGPADAAPPPPADAASGSAPSPASLPPGALPRVVVTYPRGADPADAAALATGLAEAGWTAGAPFPVARAAATPELRYFFREDRDAALAVQALGLTPLGLATARLQPVTGGLPRPGAIEAALPAAAGTPAEPPPPDTTVPPPAAVALLAPAEDAVLAQRSFTLSWRAAPEPGADFVEVLALDENSPAREVFAAYAGTAGQQALGLDRPGRYAWRVLSVSAAAQRYTPSPWRFFTLNEAPP
jgi:hypothetical protein